MTVQGRARTCARSLCPRRFAAPSNASWMVAWLWPTRTSCCCRLASRRQTLQRLCRCGCWMPGRRTRRTKAFSLSFGGCSAGRGGGAFVAIWQRCCHRRQQTATAPGAPRHPADLQASGEQGQPKWLEDLLASAEISKATMYLADLCCGQLECLLRSPEKWRPHQGSMN